MLRNQNRIKTTNKSKSKKTQVENLLTDPQKVQILAKKASANRKTMGQITLKVLLTWLQKRLSGPVLGHC